MTTDLEQRHSRLARLRELQTAVQNVERSAWLETARADQLTPEGDWSVWLVMAGRGWGKTRTGAEDIAHYARNNPGHRIAIVAPTFGDARDTCIEGESGLLAVLGDKWIAKWNRSLGSLKLVNDAYVRIYSADEPDRLRGPQHHRAWCDELAAWRYPDTWDQLQFGLRLGQHPQVIATTTPRPIKLVRDLAARTDVHVTRGSTFDNKANLSATAIATLEQRYGGTTLGRQELYGELLESLPGALWNRQMIDRSRMAEPPALQRTVVAIDPAITSGDDSDETGIIVLGLAGDHLYLLEDVSGRYPPEGWASAAIEVYRRHHADRIVAEANQGGDMVASVLRAVDRNIPLRLVHASKGKRTRAEPVSALYEQDRVHHIGSYPELEDQMCTWTPQSDISPDRMDALVWGAFDLTLTASKQARAVYSSGRGRL